MENADRVLPRTHTSTTPITVSQGKVREVSEGRGNPSGDCASSLSLRLERLLLGAVGFLVL
jgi:hypothetical protein